MLRRNDAGGVAQVVRLETHRVEVEVTQVVTDFARQRMRERRVGIDLALHAVAQQQAERAGMGADQLHALVPIEEIAADHAEHVDGGIEQIAGDHGQLIVSGAIPPGRIDRMQEQRHIELPGRVEDRAEGVVRKISPAHIGRHMPADEAMIAHAAAKLRRAPPPGPAWAGTPRPGIAPVRRRRVRRSRRCRVRAASQAIFGSR